MIVEFLNVGLPKKEVFFKKEVRTGIGKRPVPGPLRLGEHGFDGDGVADTKNHGGPDKAVCAYSLDHYPYWEEVLGVKLPPAAFGENLSVTGLKEEDVCLGDVFQLGTALVQISQPRQPCRTLATRYGRGDLVKLVVDSGFTGLYFRVLKEGTVKPGSSLTLKERDPNKISVAFTNNILHHDRGNNKGIEAVLAVKALAESWQRSFKEMREAILNEPNG